MLAPALSAQSRHPVFDQRKARCGLSEACTPLVRFIHCEADPPAADILWLAERRSR
jgi:hypothetical protein